MSASALALPSPPSPEEVRTALGNIPGIVEARLVEGHYYVIRRGVDDARDDQIIRAFLALDFEDFHFVPERMAGTVPDGIRAI